MAMFDYRRVKRDFSSSQSQIFLGPMLVNSPCNMWECDSDQQERFCFCSWLEGEGRLGDKTYMHWHSMAIMAAISTMWDLYSNYRFAVKNWDNYSISLTSINAIWGWFPLLDVIYGEVVVRSLSFTQIVMSALWSPTCPDPVECGWVLTTNRDLDFLTYWLHGSRIWSIATTYTLCAYIIYPGKWIHCL